MAPTPPPPYRRKALGGAGLLASYQGDYSARRVLPARGARRRAEATATTRPRRSILNWLGTNAYGGGDLDAAEGYVSESLALRRRIGDPAGIATGAQRARRRVPLPGRPRPGARDVRGEPRAQAGAGQRERDRGLADEPRARGARRGAARGGGAGVRGGDRDLGADRRPAAASPSGSTTPRCSTSTGTASTRPRRMLDPRLRHRPRPRRPDRDGLRARRPRAGRGGARRLDGGGRGARRVACPRAVALGRADHRPAGARGAAGARGGARRRRARGPAVGRGGRRARGQRVREHARRRAAPRRAAWPRSASGSTRARSPTRGPRARRSRGRRGRGGDALVGRHAVAADSPGTGCNRAAAIRVVMVDTSRLHGGPDAPIPPAPRSPARSSPRSCCRARARHGDARRDRRHAGRAKLGCALVVPNPLPRSPQPGHRRAAAGPPDGRRRPRVPPVAVRGRRRSAVRGTDRPRAPDAPLRVADRHIRTGHALPLPRGRRSAPTGRGSRRAPS